MKVILLLLLISIATCHQYTHVVTYVDWLMAQWGAEKCAQAIGVPGYEAKPNPYNVYNLAFAVSYGVADAAAIWMRPKQYMNYNDDTFGTTNEEIQKSWRKLYNDAGAKVMLSAFGDSWMPTQADPVSTCRRLAELVRDNNLDGLDLDYEDNDAMNKGTAEQWLIACTKAVREILPVGQYILTHAPQAPYFIGHRVYINGGYDTVNKEVGDLIDWYNIQFYNQVETRYDTYEGLFIDAKEGPWNHTAVLEIHQNCGIPLDKLVVGKPVTRKDATNTGYVPADELHDWGLKFNSEHGWNGGFMDWQYLSDIKDEDGDWMTRVVGTDQKTPLKTPFLTYEELEKVKN